MAIIVAGGLWKRRAFMTSNNFETCALHNLLQIVHAVRAIESFCLYTYHNVMSLAFEKLKRKR
jgi:hypothetical protein